MALSGGLNTFGKKILCLLTAEALYRQIDGRTDKQTDRRKSDLNSGAFAT